MCTETIQLATWNLCVGWLVAVLPMVGVVIGAVMGFGASIVLDSRKRSWELQIERREEQREALQLALEWTDPMRGAWIQALTVAAFYISSDKDEDWLHQEYPKEILSPEADFALPTHLRFHITEDMYDRAYEINAEFGKLWMIASKEKGKGKEGQEVASKQAAQLRNHIYSLRDDLKAAYQATYE